MTTRARDDQEAGPADAPRDGPAPSRHGPIAQLLIAWSPLSAILLVYWVAQWVTAPLHGADATGTNRVGAALHVLGPARADELLLGTVPSVWLQDRLVDGSAHWWDVVAGPVYVTHFIAIPLLTALAWFRLRSRFREWLAAVLTMTVLGVVGYVVYPAAPPWWASAQGSIGPVQRVSDLGWEPLHLGWVADLVELGQSGSNPVAAMPSLHAGAALLVALFLWPSVSGVLLRALLVAYALTMAVTLVYTGEHYVVDVLAGWLVAAVAALVGRRATRTPQDAVAPDTVRSPGPPTVGPCASPSSPTSSAPPPEA
jgi:membrane-associated phospholipid phosphatase